MTLIEYQPSFITDYKFILPILRPTIARMILQAFLGYSAAAESAVPFFNGTQFKAEILCDRTRDCTFGGHLDALTINFNLLPLLQDGRAGLVACGLVQSACQVPRGRLHDRRFQKSPIGQPFGWRARRADDRLEMVEFFRYAIIALGANGPLWFCLKHNGNGRGVDAPPVMSLV